MNNLITPGFLRRSAIGKTGGKRHASTQECHRHGTYSGREFRESKSDHGKMERAYGTLLGYVTSTVHRIEIRCYNMKSCLKALD